MSSWADEGSSTMLGGVDYSNIKMIVTSKKFIIIAAIVAVVVLLVIVIALAIYSKGLNDQLVAIDEVPSTLMEAWDSWGSKMWGGAASATDIYPAGDVAGMNPTPGTPAKQMITYSKPSDVGYGSSAGMAPQSPTVASTRALLGSSLA